LCGDLTSFAFELSSRPARRSLRFSVVGLFFAQFLSAGLNSTLAEGTTKTDPHTTGPAIAASSASEQHRIARLATTPAWLRLLHWDEASPGGTGKSRVDASMFFLAPNGRKDAHAELIATLAAIRDPARIVGPPGTPARCAFPARLKFLAEHFPDLASRSAADDPECKELAAFRKQLAPASVTVIFASAYPNNPASMFGHTALRIDHATARSSDSTPAASGEGQRSSDLLSTVISFSAHITTDDDPFTYTMRGIFGGYPGLFRANRYHEIVNLYANTESRDLWEFPLAMTADELDMLVLHTFELGRLAAFDYWFFDENCSWQLLALLEVARPTARLTSQFGLYALPIDTVRAAIEEFAEVGMTPVRRVALSERLRQRTAVLGPQESRVFRAAVRDDAALPIDATQKTLDALLAWYDFRLRKSGGKLSTAQQKRYLETLTRRATIPTPPATIDSRGERPDFGHPTALASLRAGGTHHGEMDARWIDISVMAAYHDFLAAPAGYSTTGAIRVMELGIRAEQVSGIGSSATSRRVRPQRLVVADVTSLHPLTALDPQWSWRMSAGSSRIESGIEAWRTGMEGGAGGTVEIGRINTLLYALALACIEHVSKANQVRVGPALLFGTIARWRESLSLDLSLRREWYRSLSDDTAGTHWTKGSRWTTVSMLNPKFAWHPSRWTDLTVEMLSEHRGGTQKITSASTGIRRWF